MKIIIEKENVTSPKASPTVRIERQISYMRNKIEMIKIHFSKDLLELVPKCMEPIFIFQ